MRKALNGICQYVPRLPYHQLPGSPLGWFHRERCLASTVRALSTLSPDTDIETAISHVVKSLGRTPGRPEQQLVQLLKDNWYSTAADVAAMSQEEVAALGMPLKLWVVLRSELVPNSGSSHPSPVSPDGLRKGPALPVPPLRADSRGLASGSQQDSRTAGQLEQGSPVSAPFMAVKGATGGAPSAAILLSPASQRAVRVRRHALKTREQYSLKEADMTPHLRKEFAALEAFSTGRFYGQLVEPLKPITYITTTYAHLRGMLGWQAAVKGIPREQLSLKGLLPTPGREAVSQLLEYQAFRAQRGCGVRSSEMPIKACIHLARYLYHDLSQPLPAGTSSRAHPPYHDLEVVQELAVLRRAATRAARAAPLVADESKKWLEWGEFLDLVTRLKDEATAQMAQGRRRRAAAASLQLYLVFAILSVVPDRQRTLRELEVGRTLVKEGDRWLIRHGPDDYKTGKQYGERPPLVIAPFIYPELEAFINEWRQELRPSHNLLFCKPVTGEPMQANDLCTLFKKGALRLTGKATNPHLVRDMIVTHLRSRGTSETDMEALALYMGHSIQMQRTTYDRRTQAQKVTPAVNLLQELSGGFMKGS